MSVQVIMKDGRPEWAVIPYAQYEALLAAAGETPADTSVVPGSSAKPAIAQANSAAKPNAFFAGMKSADASNAKFSPEKFSALKAAQGKSASAIAKDAGISPAYCEQIARGEREPSPAIIRGLAQALKIKADDLLG
ncbi:helix-turn-helix transcriptional regulator [Simiduia litorea]|uniref:helix-turn-helix domain-containing protein n=1 Tax=Simiduia litorea TaxID=1435348 RepID=UPI0036F3C152